MFWRALHEDDLPVCLDIDPRHAGDELVGKARALDAWKILVPSLAAVFLTMVFKRLQRSSRGHTCLTGRFLPFGALDILHRTACYLYLAGGIKVCTFEPISLLARDHG
jgi:hypothetical protein